LFVSDSMSQFEVKADPVVCGLASRHPEPVWGVVLIANWPPAAELHAPHARAVSALKSADEAFAEHAYVNPLETLHTTVMTCHGFAKPSPENKADYIAGWKRIVDAASTRACFPRKAFSITSSRTELHAGAGVLLYEDTDGGFKAVRDCILQEIAASRCVCTHANARLDTASRFRCKRALKKTSVVRRDKLEASGVKLHDEIVASTGGGRWAGPACHVPDIVHSTVRNRIRNRGSVGARTHTHAQSALPVMSGANSLALRAVATVAKRTSG
jgi:hypothetical protein